MPRPVTVDLSRVFPHEEMASLVIKEGIVVLQIDDGAIVHSFLIDLERVYTDLLEPARAAQQKIYEERKR